MKQAIKVLKDKVYLTEEFEHVDDIVKFVENRFGITFTNSLEFNINYYHEKDGIEYEATKFKVRWGDFKQPYIEDGRIKIDVPIDIVETKLSCIELTAFVPLPTGVNPANKAQVKSFSDVHKLKDWLLEKAIADSINMDLSVDGTDILRALKIADLQRFTPKKYTHSERKEDILENIRELVVDLNNSSLDITADSFNFDIRLKDFVYLVDKAENRWVSWGAMKTFRPVKSLSELVEKNH